MSLQKRKQAFLSIVNSIKGFVRKVGSQPPIALTNCVDDKSLIDYKIYGSSMQDRANLLNYNLGTTDSNGVTWTINSDHSITASGTPSAYSSFTIFNGPFDPNWLGQTMTFYYTAENRSNYGPVVNFYDADNTRITGDKFNRTLVPDTIHTFVVPENAVKMVFSLQRTTTNVECTGTVYPILLLGEYTIDTIPAFADTLPAPDNPIEVQSVGEKTKNVLDVTTAPIVFSTRAYAETSVVASFERTSTGFKGRFYTDREGVASQVGYILGRTEELKGKTITIRFDDVIVNENAKPYIGVYATSKQGAYVDKVDESTAWDSISNGYVGGSGTNLRIKINDVAYQDYYLIVSVPEDIDSETYPYLYTSFYIGYGADSNPAGSTFEYKGIKVEIGDNENVFDVSKATILKRLSDSTAEFEGDELVITKTRDTAQERTVVTIPTPKKNTYMNVVVNGGDGTHQYGIYMTNEIPTSPTVITTHGVNTEDYAYVNIVIVIDTAYTGTLRYKITLNECGSADYEPYGYKIPVIAKGKNMLNPIWLKQGTIPDATGNPQNSTTRVYTDYLIPLESGNYYISISDYNNLKLRIRGMHIYNYDTEMWERYINMGNAIDNLFKLSDLCKVRFVFQTPQNDAITTEDVIGGEPILAKSGGAVPYEPYVEPITTNIYIKEPLRSIHKGSGGYTDYLDFANKKVVRNVYSLYLDGSDYEDIRLHGVNSYGIANFYVTYLPTYVSRQTGMSNRLLGHNVAIADAICEGYFLGYSDKQYVYIRINSERASTVGEFKEWLKDNNLEIMYAVSESFGESFNPTNLPTLKGTTIYEVDTTTQPSKMEVEYYSTQKGGVLNETV